MGRTKVKERTKNTLANDLKPLQNDIETVNDKDINYYENRIESAIEEYKLENNIDDIKALSQLEFNALLIYIGKSVFRINNKNILDYRNTELLDGLLDIYVNICYRYKKSVSIYGYSYFVSMSYSTLNTWNNNQYRNTIYYDTDNNTYIDGTSISLYKVNHPNANIVETSNNAHNRLCKKIKAIREHCLTDKTEDGSIPSLALGKIEYGWIEGKDKQLQAKLIESYIAPSNLLDKYE
jgi:hypothetical protein